MSMTESPKADTTPQSRKPAKRKNTMERVMVLFTLIFVVGIILLTLVPEEHPGRAAAMTFYTLLIFWAVYRFGV